MNEFTKQELISLEDALYSKTAEEMPDWLNKSPLLIKLRDMIDSYCEHESDDYTYYKDGTRCTDFLTYACHDSPCFMKCKKCQELYR